VVAHAPFWVGAGERALLLGAAPHGGWMARWADRLRRPRLPRPGAITVREIAADTTLVFGHDTVRAFPLPGHTAGSVAWLVRGVLFVGDGMSHDKTDGRLRVARPSFSASVVRARASLARVAAAVEPLDVRLVCTAHARCAPATVAFRQALGDTATADAGRAPTPESAGRR
jgi:glyoxylase-like metal-dependent hydrolase (beta-lactamase superfamily II)